MKKTKKKCRLLPIRVGPLTILDRQWWIYMCRQSGPKCGLFRNDHCRPGRWGFYILGLEFGSRNPGDRFGVLLKRIGLWPW